MKRWNDEEMTKSSISAMLPFHITQPFTYLLIIPTYNAHHNMYSFLNLGPSNILATHYINRISFFSDVVLKNGSIKAGSKLVKRLNRQQIESASIIVSVKGHVRRI